MRNEDGPGKGKHEINEMIMKPELYEPKPTLDESPRRPNNENVENNLSPFRMNSIIPQSPLVNSPLPLENTGGLGGLFK